MRFTWDENKNRQNLRKHDVRFETAVLVFDDPHAITRRDENCSDEESWITVGAIGPGSILLVVHTFYEDPMRKSFASSRPAPPSPTKGEPMRKLTKDQKRDIRAIAAKKDRDIDFSDAPPVLDWSGAEIGKFYRASKEARHHAPRFGRHRLAQSRWPRLSDQANWLLRHAMLHFTKRTGGNKRKRALRRGKSGRRAA